MDSRFSWSTDYHHPTTWDQAFPPLSLPDMFAASVARKGDAPMLDFMGRQFGYAEVARGAARVARGLQQLGLGKGSRVGLFLPNVPHYVAAYFGALAAGAHVVNFSPVDRERVGLGKSGEGRVELGGGGRLKKNKETNDV